MQFIHQCIARRFRSMMKDGETARVQHYRWKNERPPAGSRLGVWRRQIRAQKEMMMGVVRTVFMDYFICVQINALLVIRTFSSQCTNQTVANTRPANLALSY